MDSKRRALLSTIATTTVLAGCLGGNEADSGSTETTTSTSMTETTTSTSETTSMTTSEATTSMTTDETNGATVQVSSHPDFGEILVGPEGRTLYLFEKDTKGKKASVCYDSCADAWPPLTVAESATKSEDVTVAVTTFERKTGENHVIAGGWPLYYFASDQKPGDAKGQGLNDVWWVVAPDGSAVKSTATATQTSY